MDDRPNGFLSEASCDAISSSVTKKRLKRLIPKGTVKHNVDRALDWPDCPGLAAVTSIGMRLCPGSSLSNSGTVIYVYVADLAVDVVTPEPCFAQKK